mgnify:CR=1 FL=1
MGKDDWLELAMKGNKKEQAAALILLKQAMMHALPNTDSAIYEIFVAPKPTKELDQLLKDREVAIQPYLDAHTEYERLHPKTADIKEYDYTLQREAWARAKDPQSVYAAESIETLLINEKTAIFKDLTDRLATIIRRAQGASTLERISHNFSVLAQAYQGKPLSDLIRGIGEVYHEFTEIAREFSSNPSDQKAYAAVAQLDSKVFELASPLLSDAQSMNLKVDFPSGKIGSVYFNGNEELWREFRHNTESQTQSMGLVGPALGEVSFYLGGMLDGKYLINPSPKLKPSDLEAEVNWAKVKLASPVQLKIEMPSMYHELVQPIIASIHQEYGNRVIAKSTLVSTEKKTMLFCL